MKVDRDEAAGSRVAVLVPCFNDGVLLRETLRSLTEQEPVELVVIDDASTEADTLEMLRTLETESVRVVRHESNQGLSAARMSGLEATRSPFVLPLDADDLLSAGSITMLADALQANPGVAVAFADYEEFGDVERHIRVPDALDRYRLRFRNEYPVTSLFRRDSLRRVGGWSDVDGMVGYEDWSLLMALASHGETGIRVGAGRVALRRRIHGSRMLGSASRNHRQLYRGLRRAHPQLFTDLIEDWRASDLETSRKLLYPLVFGARPPLGVRKAFDRLRSRI